jgi:hypothetical protein
LAAAQSICNAHVDCTGITRDNGGYEPRMGSAVYHVAAHELWMKTTQAAPICAAQWDPSKVYTIEFVGAPGQYLNLLGGGENGATNVQTYSNPTSSDSQWRIARASNRADAYTIENVNAAGQFLNVLADRKEAGTNVQTHNSPDLSATQWRIACASNRAGAYTIENVNAKGQYLNVAGGGRGDSTNVQIWDNPTSTDSQWHVQEASASVVEKEIVMNKNSLISEKSFLGIGKQAVSEQHRKAEAMTWKELKAEARKNGISEDAIDEIDDMEDAKERKQQLAGLILQQEKED